MELMAWAWTLLLLFCALCVLGLIEEIMYRIGQKRASRSEKHVTR